jgi:hypothetical protein
MIPQHIFREIRLIEERLIGSTKKCETQEEVDSITSKAASEVEELLKLSKGK